MTSGVSRSRSLPFSASAGDAKTSAIRVMLQTHSSGCGNGARPRKDKGFDIGRFMLRISAAATTLAQATGTAGVSPELPDSRRTPALARVSEVGLTGDRHLIVEQMLVVFGASFLMHGHL